MRRLKLWIPVILILVVLTAGAWAVWNFELRWRPKTLSRDQAEIAGLLQSAGWVSPGKGGRPLFLVTYRASQPGARYLAEEAPKLEAAGVDVRVIEVARPDLNGLAYSTPAERATVAQLWLSRDPKLLEAWSSVTPQAWTAPGVPPADGDLARMAVVEGGRALVAKLRPRLKDNGLTFGYPLIVWWDAKGRMRACACADERRWRFVRKDFGA